MTKAHLGICRLANLVSLVLGLLCVPPSAVYSTQAQSEIPDEVRAALFPAATNQRPTVPEKNRTSFNDSLFPQDQPAQPNTLPGDAAVPPLANGRSATDGSSAVQPASFQPTMEYAPVLDRAATPHTNQSISINELTTPNPSDSLERFNGFADQVPQRLPRAQTVAQSAQSLADEPGLAAEAPGATLAELLADSNRNLQRPRSIHNNDSNTSDVGYHEEGSDPQILSLFGSKTDWSSDNFLENLQRIAISLVVVLFLGISFIVVAKKWYRGTNQLVNPTGKEPLSGAPGHIQSTNKTVAAAAEDAVEGVISIVNRLRLDDRSNLFLIDVAGQSVLVATDESGVKSVVPITPLFTAGLEELEREDSQVATYQREHEFTPEINSNRAQAYGPAGVPVPSRMREESSPISTRTSGRSAERSGVRHESAASVNDPQQVEEEMKRRLAELLGGQAFQDVFLQNAQQR